MGWEDGVDSGVLGEGGWPKKWMEGLAAFSQGEGGVGFGSMSGREPRRNREWNRVRVSSERTAL